MFIDAKNEKQFLKQGDVSRSVTTLLTVLISIPINAQKKSQMLFLINLCKWKQCFVMVADERRQTQDWIYQVGLSSTCLSPT